MFVIVKIKKLESETEDENGARRGAKEHVRGRYGYEE